MDATRTNLNADWTVNDVVAAYPAALPVLGRYGIDACCGGLKSLREVATVHRLSLDRLLADLEGAIGPPETVLDVRPDIRDGHDPLSKILGAADRVEAGGRLVVVVGFEPVPLYRVLGERGFSHRSERTADGTWRVAFTRGA